jgi:hypothetical protein
MKKLTKTAIVVTCLSLTAFYVTSGVFQQLVTDGKRTICVVTWHIPLYGTVRLQEQNWWTFTRIWLFSLSIPPILWGVVGVRYLVSKFRSVSN